MKNAVEYIQSIPPFTYPLGNGNLKRLLEKLGNPQNGMSFIHIAGTNGKGSAAAMRGKKKYFHRKPNCKTEAAAVLYG